MQACGAHVGHVQDEVQQVVCCIGVGFSLGTYKTRYSRVYAV